MGKYHSFQMRLRKMKSASQWVLSGEIKRAILRKCFSRQTTACMSKKSGIIGNLATIEDSIRKDNWVGIMPTLFLNSNIYKYNRNEE